MIEIRTKYQTSIFGNFRQMSPTSEIIKKLIDLFNDKNFLPSTFQELSPGMIRPENRIQLLSQDNEWQIRFATQRIDIEHVSNTLKEDNIRELKTFVEESTEIFQRILDTFNKRSNRLSLITGGLLKEMNNEELKQVYYLFCKPINFYKNTPPFEWHSRHVARLEKMIGKYNEKINIITNIDRLNGSLIIGNQHIPFDRIGIAFDINTFAENDTPRFGVDEISIFYDFSMGIRDTIINEIKERLYNEGACRFNKKQQS